MNAIPTRVWMGGKYVDGKNKLALHRCEIAHTLCNDKHGEAVDKAAD